MTVRFKTDENIHPEVADLLRAHGHDAVTVWDEDLRGAVDPSIATACRREARAILTVDRGFADIRSYPPDHYSGIVVLRLARQSRRAVVAAVARLLPLLEREPLTGRLWVVSEHQVRIRSGHGGG